MISIETACLVSRFNRVNKVKIPKMGTQKLKKGVNRDPFRNSEAFLKENTTHLTEIEQSVANTFTGTSSRFRQPGKNIIVLNFHQNLEGSPDKTLPEAQRTQKLTPRLGLNLTTTWRHLH